MEHCLASDYGQEKNLRGDEFDFIGARRERGRVIWGTKNNEDGLQRFPVR
jgi:hypothetical protein